MIFPDSYLATDPIKNSHTEAGRKRRDNWRLLKTKKVLVENRKDFLTNTKYDRV